MREIINFQNARNERQQNLEGIKNMIPDIITAAFDTDPDALFVDIAPNISIDSPNQITVTLKNSAPVNSNDIWGENDQQDLSRATQSINTALVQNNIPYTAVMEEDKITIRKIN